jgi:hypothetical protein
MNLPLDPMSGLWAQPLTPIIHPKHIEKFRQAAWKLPMLVLYVIPNAVSTPLKCRSGMAFVVQDPRHPYSSSKSKHFFHFVQLPGVQV